MHELPPEDPHAIAPLTYRVALSLIPGLGARTQARLLAHCGSLEAIFSADPHELRAVRGVGTTIAAAIVASDLPAVQAQIAAWQADGIAVLLREDAEYPAALGRLQDAPPVLFRRGGAEPSGERAVAVIGTRRPDHASLALAQALGQALAGAGWTVVSGLAAGIDAAAHCGALAAGGRTIAVLGSGVRVIYPPEHRALAAAIVRQGALYAEVPPDAQPGAAALVARNRLITGLSQAVVLIETGDPGGSLHAVRFAAGQGVRVFVVDHPAAGNQRLIAQGAPVLSAGSEAGAQLLAALEGLRGGGPPSG